MDRRNGGDPLAPPRPPKLLPRVHRPRAPEPPMMSAPLSPIQQRQQQQQLCTNIHLHPQQQNHQSNNNNNNIINNRNSSNSSNSSSLVRNSNSNNNNNNNNNSDVISIHPVPITAPLIPLQLQQQQQTFNISNNSLSSTTITSTNSFTRRRPPPPILTNNNATLTLLPSISSNIIHNLEAPVSPVTLAAPRPESERLANEYVDTPFRSQQQQQQHLLHQTSRTQHPAGQTIHGQTTTQHNLLLLQQNQRRQLQQQHQHQQQQQHSHPSYNQHSSNAIISGTNTSLSHSGSGGGGGGTSTLLHSNISSSHKGSSNTTTSLGTAQTTASTTTLLLPGQTPRHHLQSQQLVSRPTVLPITSAITKQPVAFSKDVPASILHDDHDMHHSGTNPGADSPNSITCPQCKRCRCEQCQGPRKLPSRWVCNKTCLCSAEAVIDYASCLCCVKALFYHCAKDHDMEGDDGDTISCADDPCSCLPHKRAARWGWLGALSVALPCLWCYWPMRGCVALCAKCYARHYRHGCRCQSIGSTSILSTTSTTGNSTIGNAKSADGGRGGVSGGGVGHLNNHSNSGITGGNHHHHHHHSSGGGGGGGGGRTIIRTSDLTPEKRLLDSSPEY